MNTAEQILLQNSQVQSVADLIAVIRRVVEAIANDEIDLPATGNAKSSSAFCWAPSFVRGDGRPTGVYRGRYTRLQVAKFLGRTKANATQPDVDTSSAFDLLESLERGACPKQLEKIAEQSWRQAFFCAGEIRKAMAA